MSGADGLFLPILLALIASLVLLTIARRRLAIAEAAKAAESETALAGSLGSAPGSDRKLPRWLDPSVAAARFRTDTTTAARAAAATIVEASPARLPMVFTGPKDGQAERLAVRYDGVPLLDRPDDVLGRTQGELDSGDEVEVLERDEIWSRVRTPNGRSGWVLGMTLSAEAALTSEADQETPAPTEPDPATHADELPSLEAVLEAVAAQRLARHELVNGTNPERAAHHGEADPVAPKRPRARNRKTDRPAATAASGRKKAEKPLGRPQS